ncbi:MAG: DIP1984 family protein [Thermodesulfobacteriota bacterium]|nr:DIP1984 family protein [Thermodesulfobacteriota bacterium]
MKLAELLNERKSVKDEIKKLKERLYLSAKIQEGDENPAESPEEIKTALVALFEKLNLLIVKINQTNVRTIIGGKSLMELIAERDKNIAIAQALHGLTENATPKPERFSRNEIRYAPTVNIKEIRKEADSYYRKAREIDNKIQAANPPASPEHDYKEAAVILSTFISSTSMSWGSQSSAMAGRLEY